MQHTRRQLDTVAANTSVKPSLTVSAKNEVLSSFSTTDPCDQVLTRTHSDVLNFKSMYTLHLSSLISSIIWQIQTKFRRLLSCFQGLRITGMIFKSARCRTRAFAFLFYFLFAIAIRTFAKNFSNFSVFGRYPYRCTNGGEIWHGGVDRRNFTPTGATCRPCGAKSLKMAL